jgi:hypothetical protein
MGRFVVECRAPILGAAPARYFLCCDLPAPVIAARARLWRGGGQRGFFVNPRSREGSEWRPRGDYAGATSGDLELGRSQTPGCVSTSMTLREPDAANAARPGRQSPRNIGTSAIAHLRTGALRRNAVNLIVGSSDSTSAFGALRKWTDDRQAPAATRLTQGGHQPDRNSASQHLGRNEVCYPFGGSTGAICQ